MYNDPYQQPQPNTNYPEYQSPPPMPPRKPSFWKRKVGCLPMWAIILIVFLAIVFYSIGSAATRSSTDTTAIQATDTATATTQPATDTPIPTATLDKSVSGYTPPPSQKWTTTHTFTGNGSKKTGTFSVPGDWKIVWKCNPASFDVNYNVIITVYNSDGTYADSGVNATCSRTNTHDETEEHQSGNVYLDITSEGDWTIQVQELK